MNNKLLIVGYGSSGKSTYEVRFLPYDKFIKSNFQYKDLINKYYQENMSLKEKILEKLNEINELLINKDTDLHLKMLGVSDLFNGSPGFNGTKICRTCYDFSFEESSIWDCSKCKSKDSVCSGCCKDKDEETCYYCNYNDDHEYKEISDLKKIIEKLDII